MPEVHTYKDRPRRRSRVMRTAVGTTLLAATLSCSANTMAERPEPVPTTVGTSTTATIPQGLFRPVQPFIGIEWATWREGENRVQGKDGLPVDTAEVCDKGKRVPGDDNPESAGRKGRVAVSTVTAKYIDHAKANNQNVMIVWQQPDGKNGSGGVLHYDTPPGTEQADVQVANDIKAGDVCYAIAIGNLLIPENIARVDEVLFTPVVEMQAEEARRIGL